MPINERGEFVREQDAPERERNPNEQMHLYPKTELIINNGRDIVTIDRALVGHELSDSGLSEKSIMKLLSVVGAYAEKVKNELTKGVHLGSTSLELGIQAEFNPEQFADFGLQTPTELRLAAALIKNICVKKKRFTSGKIE